MVCRDGKVLLCGLPRWQSFTLWSAEMAKFYPVVCRDGKVHYSAGSLFSFLSFFFFFFLTITRSGRLSDCLYFNIPKDFVRLIFGFRVMQMPFFRMVKFKLFAQFPVDHLPHPVVCTLSLSVR